MERTTTGAFRRMGQKVTERLAYKTQEAAEMLGIGRTFLYELIKRGELPVRKCGGRTLVLAEDLKLLLARLPVVQPRGIPNDQ
jgi:excisionase family DNA binding protein